jgi:hypothetical protein
VGSNADRTYLVGSSAAGGAYQWIVNGQPAQTGVSQQLMLLHADDSAADTAGRDPLDATGVGYAPGRWGRAWQIEPRGTLAYPREGRVEFEEGTVELWVALREDGSAATYSERDHAIFSYRAANGETMAINQARAGIVYAGGTVRGQWESAYGSRGSMNGWKAGEWHHLAFTYSTAGNWMRFYVDGILTADTNERHYWPPAATGDRFTIGGSAGTPAAYWIDEVRTLNRPLTADQVKRSARRADPIRNHEVWLPAAGLSPGDKVIFVAADCPSEAYTWRGITLTEATPPSTLLPPGSRTVELSLRSSDATTCTYAVGAGAPQPFDNGQGSTTHQTLVRGLSPDPSTVNQVAIRCASDPDFVLPLQYRALPVGSPDFPRKGNLWGSSGMAQKGLPYAARVDLYLGAHFNADEIRRLRALNPNILVLTSINTVENSGLAEDYYLHDTEGRRIEVWPNTYRLNLTKPYVAEFQAKFAYQTLLDSGLMADGCFFDNFFTTQSWVKSDIYGRKLQVDADEDGLPDDPAWLDREWGKGVYLELETWRKLMPYALASGHLPRPPQAQFAAIFNGDSIGFQTSDVLEGKIPFQTLWDTYHNWFTMGRQPTIMMVESSPQDQISYGYSYNPDRQIPPSTLEFARTYYPSVRFGLGVTLMNDGYFAHEFGDTWHGNDWWYDELNFNLGQPLAAAQRVAVGSVSTANLVDNGGFDAGLEGTWRLNVNSGVGAAATLERDFRDPARGPTAHLTVTNAGQGVDWHIEFAQYKRSLEKGKRYDLIFQARADAARPLGLSAQKDSPDWNNYGLSQRVQLGTEWKAYTVTFQANATVQDSRLQFWVGTATGEVWLDDIQLVEHPADVYRRDFTHGIALLNGSAQTQTIEVGPGFKRLTGEQAPRHEYLVDDAGAAFTATGGWRVASYDSGEWTALGPFYHAWNGKCHQLDAGAGQAEWSLGLRADDTYTIDVWWAAAPGAAGWTKRAVFEVVAGGRVVATATLDQSTGGDQWHGIATLALSVKDAPVVRVRNEGSGALVADALHVRSAARYNDGSPSPSVTLEAMDSIILARER